MTTAALWAVVAAAIVACAAIVASEVRFDRNLRQSQERFDALHELHRHEFAWYCETLLISMGSDRGSEQRRDALATKIVKLRNELGR